MITLRLAHFNIKRIFRHVGLRWVILLLPIVVALASALFAKSESVLIAARLCPFVCALVIGAALYTQWSVDSVSGLIAGFHASPLSPRSLIISRVMSGFFILIVQMTLFILILMARF